MRQKTLWHYTGKTWSTLKEACSELHLDMADVRRYIKAHPCSNPLAAYIQENRIVLHGVIYNSLTEAALCAGVQEERLKHYLSLGFGFDLAIYMIRAGIQPDFFEVCKNEQKNNQD